MISGTPRLDLVMSGSIWASAKATIRPESVQIESSAADKPSIRSMLVCSENLSGSPEAAAPWPMKSRSRM